MAAVRAADAGEAVGKVATLEIIVDYLGDDGAKEAIVLDESFVIDLRERVKITVQQIPQWRLFWCARMIGLGGMK
jgi:hypothetical protein